MRDLKLKFIKETHQNKDAYLPFVNNNCISELRNGLKEYILNKNYDTAFGDLVPLIAANALGINIIIVSKQRSYEDVLVIPDNHKHHKSVCILKTGDHYDSLFLRRNAGNSSDTGVTTSPRAKRGTYAKDNNYGSNEQFSVLNHDCNYTKLEQSKRIKGDFDPEYTYGKSGENDDALYLPESEPSL